MQNSEEDTSNEDHRHGPGSEMAIVSRLGTEGIPDPKALGAGGYSHFNESPDLKVLEPRPSIVSDSQTDRDTTHMESLIMRKEGFPATVRGSRTSNQSTLSLSECIAAVVPNVELERDHCLILSESDSSPVIVSINENSSATSLTQPETQKQTVPLHKEASRPASL